jgi:hypothetical protein
MFIVRAIRNTNTLYGQNAVFEFVKADVHIVTIVAEKDAIWGICWPAERLSASNGQPHSPEFVTWWCSYFVRQLLAASKSSIRAPYLQQFHSSLPSGQSGRLSQFRCWGTHRRELLHRNSPSPQTWLPAQELPAETKNINVLWKQKRFLPNFAARYASGSSPLPTAEVMLLKTSPSARPRLEKPQLLI